MWKLIVLTSVDRRMTTTEHRVKARLMALLDIIDESGPEQWVSYEARHIVGCIEEDLEDMWGDEGV